MKDGASIYIGEGAAFRATFTPYLAAVSADGIAIHFQGIYEAERLDAIHRLMDGLEDLEAKVHAAVYPEEAA